jgi:DNA-binding transcriptional regulator YiaG
VNVKVKPLEKRIKELNLAGLQMRKTIDRQQQEISALKKDSGSGDKLNSLPPEALEKSRLTPKLISVLRKKLKLSRSVFGKLLGVTGHTVFTWESGRSRPRPAYKAKIVSLRGIGKRGIAKILQESKS